jgi:RNA polymerase sigma-70 factor (ECF subfamily)
MTQVDESRWSELAAATRRGDAASFRILVEGLTRELVATAFRFTRDWDSARDLTQETWIKVYERIDQYREDRPFRPWLRAVHRNGCLSHLRKAFHREEPTDATALQHVAGTAHTPNPLARLETQEFLARLRKAMAKLSERQSLAFALVDIEQVPQTAAADVMRIKPQTLRTTLHHARRRLARILRREEVSSER